MSVADVIVVAAAVLLIAALGWFFLGPRRAGAAEPAEGVRRGKATVRGGHSPDLIHVWQGVPAALVTPTGTEPAVDVGADRTAAHQHAYAGRTQNDEMSRVTDPACGMPITPETSAEQRDTPDGTRSFCSAACARAFDADPSRYQTMTTEGM